MNEKTILHQQITESKEEKKATAKENLSLKYELEIRDDKIKRIQNSFSWKITALLRFLRRKVIDPFKSSLKDDFDPVVYLELNPDLQESFKGNLEEATKHFHLHGLKEKRAYSYQIAPPLHLRTYEEWIRGYDTKTSL